MFLQLVYKEMKYQARSITFYLFLAVVLMFYASQFMPELQQETLEPQPGQFYGFKQITNQENEIKAVFLDIYSGYNNGQILKQGLLINKTVRLNEEQKAEMKAALDKLGGFKEQAGPTPMDNVEVKASYEEYLQTVRALDQALGGGTYYGDKLRRYILSEPMTYEDAVKEFEDIRDKDRITNAYGRLFGDYMGITAGLFPIFLSAFVLTRDKRSRMQELIYSRSISSVQYVLSKYVALLTMMTIFYLLLAAHATFGTISMAHKSGFAVDALGIFRFAIAWLMPTLMFSTALGMLISIVLGNGVAAIFVQFVVWLISISSLGGNYELYRAVVRFNTLGGYQNYISWLPQITANRIFYTILSVILIMAAAWVLSLKRGSANGFKTAKNSMVQS